MENTGDKHLTNFMYRPPKDSKDAEHVTLGVKFANDVFLMKSYLDQKGIQYDEKDLEDGPMGQVLRIKREVKL